MQLTFSFFSLTKSLAHFIIVLFSVIFIRGYVLFTIVSCLDCDFSWISSYYIT